MKELEIIREYYGNQTAKRSGVPLINHIYEGLKVLTKIGASDYAKRAYCMHPIFQSDADFEKNCFKFSHKIESEVVALVIEYRSIANQYLSYRKISNISEIKLSPVNSVNQMLIADKVQNYKDFLAYHKGTHERSEELDEYFNNWFKALDVNYNELVKAIQ